MLALAVNVAACLLYSSTYLNPVHLGHVSLLPLQFLCYVSLACTFGRASACLLLSHTDWQLSFVHVVWKGHVA